MTITSRERVIDGVCAWPNLTLLPNGHLVATIFNQPCHGMWQGDLDCWGSSDGGWSWTFLGRPGAHKGETNRMNCAVGLSQQGDLLVAVSGWSHRDVPGHPRPHREGRQLQAEICRSSDGGRTWTVIGRLPDNGDDQALVPFGDIHTAADGALCLSTYGWSEALQTKAALLWRSYDDGASWGEPVCLESRGNETAILHLGHGHWIAACRVEKDVHLELLISEDDGRTWINRGWLTESHHVTGHLLELSDGRILLCYGNRVKDEFGVMARFSRDGGFNWDEPFRLASTPAWDCGYPSSVQLADGRIVTAYYSQHPERGPYQYQMDVVEWEP